MDLYLNRDYKVSQEMNIHLHPSITINGENFDGDHRNMNELFKIICGKLEERPQECKDTGLNFLKKAIFRDYVNEYG